METLPNNTGRYTDCPVGGMHVVKITIDAGQTTYACLKCGRTDKGEAPPSPLWLEVIKGTKPVGALPPPLDKGNGEDVETNQGGDDLPS